MRQYGPWFRDRDKFYYVRAAAINVPVVCTKARVANEFRYHGLTYFPWFQTPLRDQQISRWFTDQYSSTQNKWIAFVIATFGAKLILLSLNNMFLWCVLQKKGSPGSILTFLWCWMWHTKPVRRLSYASL